MCTRNKVKIPAALLLDHYKTSEFPIYDSLNINIRYLSIVANIIYVSYKLLISKANLSKCCIM